MSRLQVAESLVDAFMDGKYEVLKNLDDRVDDLVESSILEGGELNAYQKFFKQKLASAGKPIAKMSAEEKKAFFKSIKTGWAKEKAK